jgi:hypothetical protein
MLARVPEAVRERARVLEERRRRASWHRRRTSRPSAYSGRRTSPILLPPRCLPWSSPNRRARGCGPIGRPGGLSSSRRYLSITVPLGVMVGEWSPMPRAPVLTVPTASLAPGGTLSRGRATSSGSRRRDASWLRWIGSSRQVKTITGRIKSASLKGVEMTSRDAAARDGSRAATSLSRLLVASLTAAPRPGCVEVLGASLFIAAAQHVVVALFRSACLPYTAKIPPMAAHFTSPRRNSNPTSPRDAYEIDLALTQSMNCRGRAALATTECKCFQALAHRPAHEGAAWARSASRWPFTVARVTIAVSRPSSADVDARPAADRHHELR